MKSSREIKKWPNSTLWFRMSDGYHIIDGFEYDRKFRYAKPVFNKHILYYDGFWDLHELDDDDFINSLSVKTTSTLKAIFNSIRPYYGTKLKAYVIGENFCCNIDLPRLIKSLDIDEAELFRYNFNLEDPTALAIYNLNTEKIVIIEDVGLPGDNLIPIKVFGKKWGFITISDFDQLEFENYVIEPIYEFAVGFIEGLSKVKYNGLFGFINPQNEIVIPFEYDDALSFKNGYALVAVAKCKEDYFSRNASYGFYSDQAHPNYSWLAIDNKNTPKSPIKHNGRTTYNYIKPTDPRINISISQMGLEDLVELKKCEYVFNDYEEEMRYNEFMHSADGIEINPISLDFDLTQAEIDLMTGRESLLEKYGKIYFNWMKDLRKERNRIQRNRVQRNLEDMMYESMMKNNFESNDYDEEDDTLKWNID